MEKSTSSVCGIYWRTIVLSIDMLMEIKNQHCPPIDQTFVISLEVVKVSYFSQKTSHFSIQRGKFPQINPEVKDEFVVFEQVRQSFT